MAPSLQYGPPPQFAQLPDASTRNYLASPCHVDLRYAPITATGRSNRPNSLITAGPPKSGWPNCSLSVQEAGYFKPHRKTYEKSAEILGLATMECMHVANHTFDCVGAKAAGMRTAFIDRRNRPFGQTQHNPDITISNMTELADLLG